MAKTGQIKDSKVDLSKSCLEHLWALISSWAVYLLLTLQTNLNFLHEAKCFDEEIDYKYHNLYEKVSEIYRHKCNRVKTLESEISNFLSLNYSVTLNSGTDALVFALKALGIGHDDEVITVPNTYIATVAAIYHVGARPVFVDVGPDHLMDPAGIFATSPGWRIVAPSNAADYIGLMNTALSLQDPTLVIEHVGLYQEPQDIPAEDLDYQLPFGKAALRISGEDLTVI